MKNNILLANKKYFLPPAKTVLGQFPRGKLPSYKTSPKPKANPNPNPNRGAFSFGRNRKQKKRKTEKK